MLKECNVRIDRFTLHSTFQHKHSFLPIGFTFEGIRLDAVERADPIYFLQNEFFCDTILQIRHLVCIYCSEILRQDILSVQKRHRLVNVVFKYRFMHYFAIFIMLYD